MTKKNKQRLIQVFAALAILAMIISLVGSSILLLI